MHPLARRIALLVSVFSLLAGVFLLGYNLRLVPAEASALALNLWPVLLIAAGILLVVDSTRKRGITRADGLRTQQFPLPSVPTPGELSCRIQFSYGTLVTRSAEGQPRLLTEQAGPAPEPSIVESKRGSGREISIAIGQPLFPSHFQLHNTWRLELPRSSALRLFVHLHEADLLMDLRRLTVESLDLRAESGDQQVFLPRPDRKMAARIYASGSTLTLVLPARVFAYVRLLNPFCRIDYPQGDLEKKEDGSLVTVGAGDTRGSVDVEVDGPLRALSLDIDEAAET